MAAWLGLLLLVFPCGFLAAQTGATDAIAPPDIRLNIRALNALDEELVVVDGTQTQDVTLPAGQSLEVEIGGVTYSLEATVQPARTFSFGGLRFEFPGRFTDSYQVGKPNPEVWTLGGNDTHIMVQKYAQIPSGKLRRILDKEILSLYEDITAQRREIILEAESRRVSGQEFTVDLGYVVLVSQLYLVDAGENTFALIIQDRRENATEPTAEFAEVSRLLRETIEFPDDI